MGRAVEAITIKVHDPNVQPTGPN